MTIRDRIKDFRRVAAASLRPHPRNWRMHPPEQQAALRGILHEIGYADALLARELPDGSLQLVDGHLRAETTPEAEVPVLVLDLTEAEADKLLVALDPLAGLAETNGRLLAELLETATTHDAALAALFDRLAEEAGRATPAAVDTPPLDIPAVWQVVVECRDETEQRDVFEQLHAAGRRCRLLTL